MANNLGMLTPHYVLARGSPFRYTALVFLTSLCVLLPLMLNVNGAERINSSGAQITLRQLAFWGRKLTQHSVSLLMVFVNALWAVW